jgi:dipeptidyl aminopeptidase/acylaminoacyl peptidase
MSTTRLLSRLTVAMLSAALAACTDTTTEPVAVDGARVAITEFQGARPVLLAGDIGGANRTRIRFQNVTDQIPDNHPGLVVTDERLLALGSPSISPDGSRVAVVATLAHDQSEVVVMKMDGTGGDVASVNTQIIGSAPEWSPDGTKLAYTMSTKPGFTGLDLFITDLATHTVTRLTTDQNLAEAVIAWSTDGKSIYYTRRAVTTAIPGEPVNEMVEVIVATKEARVRTVGIVGQVASIWAYGGTFLVTREVATTGGVPSRSLIELGGERVILESGAVWARYLRVYDYAVVVTATPSEGGVTRHYAVMQLSSKKQTPIAGVSGEANVDVRLTPMN